MTLFRIERALEPVTEDQNFMTDEDAAHEAAARALQAAVDLQSPGAASHMSGETLGTQSTAPFGATDIDIEEANYILPLLNDTADGVLNIVAPSNASPGQLLSIIGDVKNFQSKASNQLRRREANFITQYEGLNTEGAFLRPDMFVASLMNAHNVLRLDASLFRPDDLLFKANLTNMARKIAQSDRNAEADSLLRELNMSFPDLFISRFGVAQIGLTAIGSSNLQKDTFELALDIRTQLLITKLELNKDEPGFNPDVHLGQVFYRPTAPDAEPELQGWGVEEMAVEPVLWQAFQQSVTQRLENIRAHFGYTEANLVDWDALDGEFPWTGFQVQALTWAGLRRTELNELIQDHGGAKAIADMFEEMQKTGKIERSVPKDLTPRRQAQGQPTGRGKRGSGAPRGRKPRSSGNAQ